MPFFKKDFEKSFKMELKYWANLHPIDVWWRREFKIPFGSKEHLETNFIEQLRCYEEQEYLENLRNNSTKDENGNLSVKELSEDEKEVYDKIEEELLNNLDKL